MVAELRKSEERLRLTFEDAPVGIATMDLDGRFLQANRALCEMLGCSQELLLTRDLDDVTSGAEFRKHLREVVAPSGRCSWERRLLLPGGESLWASLHAATIQSGDANTAHAVLHVEDITARKAAEEQLASLALHDPLTTLPNRLLIMDRVGHGLRQMGRFGTLMAVLFLDLDHFKIVNDTLGHESGDRLLVEAADRLVQVVRYPDSVGRLAGDEFVVVGHVKQAEDAVVMSDRIRAAIARPMRIGGADRRITTSVGIVVADTSGADPADLLRAADTALYDAKRTGRNRHSVYGDMLGGRALARIDTERDLSTAIDEQRLHLDYQPIIEVVTGRIVALEALVRIDHPTRGRLYPDAFLAVAEATGLIVPLGRAVLDRACAQIAAWKARLSDPPRVHVNISPRQLADADLADAVTTALARTGADPALLVLEITETTLLEASPGFVEALEGMREAGVQIYLDNFGTGHNSLSHVRRVPADAIKIAQAFTAGLGADEQNTAIVRSVVRLADDLGLAVVAGGIETAEQFAALKRLGCPMAQGFHLARPADADAIFQRLNDPLLRQVCDE